MNFFKSLILSLIVFTPLLTIASEPLTQAQLTADGTRIGKAYNTALKADNSTGQDAALSEFNDYLATLRKQEQIDIFSLAFTHSNIEITQPDKDASIYSRAVIKALRACDSIGIEDAYDIATTVLLRYETEKDSATARQYRKYYNAAITASRLGLDASMAASDSINTIIINQAKEQREAYSTDSIASKVWDDCFDYHSIRLSSVEEDATKYANRLIEASKSGEQSKLDAELRIIGYIYERYYIDRSEADAKHFNTRVNEIYEQYELARQS